MSAKSVSARRRLAPSLEYRHKVASLLDQRHAQTIQPQLTLRSSRIVLNDRLGALHRTRVLNQTILVGGRAGRQGPIKKARMSSRPRQMTVPPDHRPGGTVSRRMLNAERRTRYAAVAPRHAEASKHPRAKRIGPNPQSWGSTTDRLRRGMLRRRLSRTELCKRRLRGDAGCCAAEFRGAEGAAGGGDWDVAEAEGALLHRRVSRWLPPRARDHIVERLDDEEEDGRGDD